MNKKFAGITCLVILVADSNGYDRVRWAEACMRHQKLTEAEECRPGAGT